MLWDFKTAGTTINTGSTLGALNAGKTLKGNSGLGNKNVEGPSIYKAHTHEIIIIICTNTYEGPILGGNEGKLIANP